MYKAGRRSFGTSCKANNVGRSCDIDAPVQARRKLKAGLGGTMDDEVNRARESEGRLRSEAEPVFADIALDGEYRTALETEFGVWGRIDRTAVIAKQPARSVNERDHRMPPLGELAA
jgi:hypothetical protein